MSGQTPPPGLASRLLHGLGDLLTRPDGESGTRGESAGTRHNPERDESPTLQNDFGLPSPALVDYELRNPLNSDNVQQYVASMTYGERTVERYYDYSANSDEVERWERGLVDGDLVYERTLEPAHAVEGKGFHVRALYRRDRCRHAPEVLSVEDYAAYDGFKRADMRVGETFEVNMELHPAGELDDDLDRYNGAGEAFKTVADKLRESGLDY